MNSIEASRTEESDVRVRKPQESARYVGWADEFAEFGVILPAA